MKIKHSYILFLICISCGQVSQQQYDNEEGLLIERLKVDNKDVNKYNNDNVIYTVGKKITFQYDYEKNGISYLYEQNGKEWSFVSKDSISSHPNTITNVILEVVNGNPIEKYIPNYNQTVIKYKYPPLAITNATGLVENEENIWMHPPRQSLFQILELNPFPYAKLPLKIGKKWLWKLKIGDSWSDERWKLWNGAIFNVINYKVIDYRKESTPFGNLNCYVISSSGKSKIGNTYLTAYFNETYGFIKLDYINIDNSTLKLEAINYEDK